MTKTGAQAKTASSRIAGKEHRRKQRVKNELLQEEIHQETPRAQAKKRPSAEKRDRKMT